MRSSKIITEQKYLQVLQEIYSVLQVTSKISLSSLCEKRGLNKVVVSVMKKGGLIENIGHGKGSIYQWITIEPNLEMARELSKRVNQTRNSYRANTKKKNFEIKNNEQEIIFNHTEKKPTNLITEDIVRDILILSKKGLSGRDISKKLNISESSVFKYRKILDGREFLNLKKEFKLEYSITKLLWGLIKIKTKHFYK